MEQPGNIGGYKPDADETFVPLRQPAKFLGLSPIAPEFVPRSQQQQQPGGGAYHHPGQQHYQQPQMDMHQSSQSTLVQHRFAAAQQGNVEPGGGGGGGFDYQQQQQQQQMGHHLGGNNGAMANGSNDPGKTSSVQSRLSQMRIGGGGGGGGMSRGDNNGKEFNHHQHHQQPMQQQHLQQQQHRVQQQSPYQQHQGHHGHNHHQPHGQQLHQSQYAYGHSYSNAIHNQLNHPMLGAANHHMGGGGGMGDTRKHNGGGGGGGQHHHRSRQQQQHHHQHHHHQQQQQHHQGSHHHHGGGGGGGGGGGHGMMAGGNMGPMAGGGGNANVDYNDDEQTSDIQSFALDYLTEVIAELFDNPGMFEEVKEKLSNMFVDFRDDHYVLSNAVEMIFEQSIKESNFRYMGARLCQLLDSLDNKPESLMRELLLLKMDDQQSELPNYMKQEQVKVRGTTLFLAELYMQLRSPQQKLGQDIARHIIHAINNLLVKEGPENLKCICQCLKLCGFELQQDCHEEVQRILAKLQQSQSTSQSSVSNLIKSVLDLESKSWGRSEEIVPVAPAMSNLMGGAVLAMGGGGGGLEFNDSPVFYGPDGEILTEEENSFLETNMVNKQNTAYNGYDDDEEVFDDMNPEEVNLAYKDFLQSVPNEQQQH